MLIKVKPNLFINPNHVAAVELTEDGATVTLTQHIIATPPSVVDITISITISTEAAGYLLEIMETASAITFPGEPGYIDPNMPSMQPLTSQIAILLRDTFPQGATADQLIDTLHLDYHVIYAALDSLIAERVVSGPAQNDTARYFHTQHAPRDYAPELICVNCSKIRCDKCAIAGKCCFCGSVSFYSPTPSPDLLVVDEAPELSLEEDTEKTEGRTTER